METLIQPRADGAGVGTGVSPGRAAASWPAIFAGAFVAIGVSLILLTLGAGLGFAAVSPWTEHGVSSATFTVTTAIWLIVTQWISACLGGYIAGRLRTRWLGTHADEIFFRDTAHGLVVWALATVLVFAVVGSSLVGAIGGGLHAATDLAAAGAQGALSSIGSSTASYDLDKLFRANDSASSVTASSESRLEAGRIVANAVVAGTVSEADRSYLANLVAAKTGISPTDAQKRIDDLVAAATDAAVKLKAEADAARKAAAQASIYTALSLLVGAFIASVSAALGGRLRDEHL